MALQPKKYRCCVLNWLDKTKKGALFLNQLASKDWGDRLLHGMRTKPRCGIRHCPQCKFHSSCNENLNHDLDELEKWCRKNAIKKYDENRFVAQFRQAIFSAKRDYLRNKKKTWNKWGLLFYAVGCAVASPILLELILSNIINPLIEACGASQSFWEGIQAWMGASGTGLLLGGVFAMIVAVILLLVKQWREQKNFRETWVRHSARFGRMELALQEFLLYSDEARKEQFGSFVKKVFSISERNLDQFELSMSGNGLADSQKEAN